MTTDTCVERHVHICQSTPAPFKYLSSVCRLQPAGRLSLASQERRVGVPEQQEEPRSGTRLIWALVVLGGEGGPADGMFYA